MQFHCLVAALLWVVRCGCGRGSKGAFCLTLPRSARQLWGPPPPLVIARPRSYGSSSLLETSDSLGIEFEATRFGQEANCLGPLRLGSLLVRPHWKRLPVRSDCSLLHCTASLCRDHGFPMPRWKAGRVVAALMVLQNVTSMESSLTRLARMKSEWLRKSKEGASTSLSRYLSKVLAGFSLGSPNVCCQLRELTRWLAPWKHLRC